VLRRIKGGKPALVTLGGYPALSLAEARKLARKTIVEMASGIDPRARIKATRSEGMTVAEALDGYLALRAARLKSSTAAAYRSIMSTELKPLAHLPVRTLTGEMVVQWHGRFASRSLADRAGRVLRAVLRYANDRHGLLAPDGRVATDALRSLRLWTPARRKTRTVGNMTAWRASIQRCPEPVRDLFLCLAATGLRRDELRLAEWEQVDLGQGTLHLPDPKSRRPVTLPLPSQAHEVLARRRGASNGVLVFSNDGVTPLGLKTLARWLSRTSGELGARWSPHDLRRGYLSAAALIAPSYVVKRLAHHAITTADVTDGYIQLTADELRSWAQLTADKILSINT
jgi:integrase